MTDASQDIRPALTAEEWEQGFVPANHFGQHDGSAYTVERRHALAALCLYGQDFGFDGPELNVPASSIVEALRDTAEAIDNACGTKMIGVVRVCGPAGEFMIPAYFPEMFRALAARIAALLPPTQ